MTLHWKYLYSIFRQYYYKLFGYRFKVYYTAIDTKSPLVRQWMKRGGGSNVNNIEMKTNEGFDNIILSFCLLSKKNEPI
jgi:hypothetical protein